MKLGRPHHEPEVGAWLLPMPTIDGQIVRQSALALERYGPDFTYSPYIAARRLPVAAGIAGEGGASVVSGGDPGYGDSAKMLASSAL